MGQYCFALASVAVCNAASERAGWPPFALVVKWLTLHSGQVWLRPVPTLPTLRWSVWCRPCYKWFKI